MNHLQFDILIQQARREDDLRAAQNHRLVNEALRYQRPQRISLSLNSIMVSLAKGMAWLGSLLTTWSCRLQSRYVVPVTSTQPEPCTSQ